MLKSKPLEAIQPVAKVINYFTFAYSLRTLITVDLISEFVSKQLSDSMEHQQVLPIYPPTAHIIYVNSRSSIKVAMK